MIQENVILTFSHLRWDFVHQRPQHLLTRFASQQNCRVVFIEEPVQDRSDVLFWERSRPEPRVLVARPHTPVAKPGFCDEQLPALRKLLRELVSEEGIRDFCAWFYTPMALPLARELKPRVVVYDAMDELSAFLDAPPELLQREEELFQIADVVFTGGRSLYRAKKDRHPNVHCFPSSVDVKHFGQASRPLPEPADQAAIPHPRLGFFGVIDERMDLDLLDAVADAHPEWQIVMVGPVVKIEEENLPRHPNIHYLGQKSYRDLPAYLSNWDVCLLPFARNEATRFISPTKTLEYMAAGKMIVSTPITDVAEPYGQIVYLGDTPEEFIAACERALAAPPARAARVRRGCAKCSPARPGTPPSRKWGMLVALAAARSRRDRGGRAAPGAWWPAPVRPGLSAAYHLGEDALLIEQNDRVGGWCRSIEVDGFTFDYAGHIMFSNEHYVHQLYQMLLGDNVHWQDREAWIFSKGVYTRYPFQGALYGLPPQVIKECLVGAIEARFGSLKPPERARPRQRKANGNGSGCKPGSIDRLLRRRDSGERSRAGRPPRRSRAPQLRGIHLQGLGRRDRETLCDSVQPETLGGSADGDGDILAGRARAASRSRGNDRRGALSPCRSRWGRMRASAIRCAAASRP